MHYTAPQVVPFHMATPWADAVQQPRVCGIQEDIRQPTTQKGPCLTHAHCPCLSLNDNNLPPLPVESFSPFKAQHDCHLLQEALPDCLTDHKVVTTEENRGEEKYIKNEEMAWEAEIRAQLTQPIFLSTFSQQSGGRRNRF